MMPNVRLPGGGVRVNPVHHVFSARQAHIHISWQISWQAPDVHHLSCPVLSCRLADRPEERMRVTISEKLGNASPSVSHPGPIVFLVGLGEFTWT
jgi:hypothetical protein